MIVAKSLESLYLNPKYKSKLRLLMALDKPQTHAKLEFGFTDSNGANYFKYPQDTSIAIERWGKMNEYMMWMSAGLTSGELDKLVHEGKKAIADGLAVDTRNVAKLSIVFDQIEQRKNMVIHTELFYNYVAIQLIREDERPEEFNNEIQMQKVEQFKKEVAQGNCYDFFFRLGLSKLNALMDMSKSEWEQFWESSRQEQQLLNEAVKVLQSKKTSSRGAQTSAKK